MALRMVDSVFPWTGAMVILVVPETLIVYNHG